MGVHDFTSSQIDADIKELESSNHLESFAMFWLNVPKKGSFDMVCKWNDVMFAVSQIDSSSAVD